MPCVLIMEDDEEVRKALRTVLEESGYKVMEAANGEKGLKIQRTIPSDLVIMDILMPEKEGLEVIKELRRDFPNTKIIAISGGGYVGPDYYLDAAKKMGASYVFEKPFDPREIMAAVKQVLG